MHLTVEFGEFGWGGSGTKRLRHQAAGPGPRHGRTDVRTYVETGARAQTAPATHPGKNTTFGDHPLTPTNKEYRDGAGAGGGGEKLIRTCTIRADETCCRAHTLSHAPCGWGWRRVRRRRRGSRFAPPRLINHATQSRRTHLRVLRPCSLLRAAFVLSARAAALDVASSGAAAATFC